MTLQPSFWGQHIEYLNTTAWPPIYVNAYRTWYTQYSGSTAHWADLETARGVYNWTPLDNIVSTLQAHHCQIVYCFGIVPGWANGSQTGDIPPTSFTDFYNFVTALVTRYAGKIQYYELWNEVNNAGAPVTGWWSGTVAQMVTLCQNTYPIIKSIDPNALVLSPSVEGATGFAYMQQLLAGGLTGYFDLYCWHGYAANTYPLHQPEQTLNLAQNYAAIASQNSSPSTTIVSEGGNDPSVPTALAPAFASVYNIMLASQSTVQTVCWFQYDNGNSYGQLNGGTLLGGLNPVGMAYRETQKWLSGCTFTQTPTRTTNTNGVRNTTLTGTAAGTPGTPPTDWSVYSPDTASHGITTQIVGTGTEGGVPYMDFRVHGTATTGASGQVDLFFEGGQQIAATLGQQWTTGLNVKLQSGSSTGVTVTLGLNENNSSGTFLDNITSWQFQPYTLQLNLCNQAYPGATSASTVAYVQPFVQLGYSVGQAIDITLRVGNPSCDNGSIWTAIITKPNSYQGQLTWDAGGGPTTYTFPTGQGYTTYRDLTGYETTIAGTTVPLTNAPILLESTPWKGAFL